MTLAICAAAMVVAAAVAFEVWRTVRGRRTAGITAHIGRHRPTTVQLVDDLHLITYPALFEQYRRYVELYGYGAGQADYWCWRKARIAELRNRAALRRMQREIEADYGWLAAWEPTDIRELVNA